MPFSFMQPETMHAVMSKPKSAKEVMTKPAQWAMPGDTRREVAERMLALNFSQFPVWDRGGNAGRVTDPMLCRELAEARGVEVAMRKVMELDKIGKPFEELTPDTSLEEVRRALVARNEQAVLVRGGGRPQDWGIIMRFDLLKLLTSDP